MKIVQGDTSNSLPIPKIFQEVESEGTPYNPLNIPEVVRISACPKNMSEAMEVVVVSSINWILEPAVPTARDGIYYIIPTTQTNDRTKLIRK